MYFKLSVYGFALQVVWICDCGLTVRLEARDFYFSFIMLSSLISHNILKEIAERQHRIPFYYKPVLV